MLKRISVAMVLVALVVAVLLSFFALFIAGPENFEKIFTRDRVVRTLEVTALVSYRGRPVRLSARTVCWAPVDYFRAVSMEARPQQVASALPDGSVIAFRGTTHLCRYAEKAITAELGAASGPRVLRRQTPVPALPAIWFSKPRKPDLIEESVEPTSVTPRYRPISFSIREVPSGAPHVPQIAFRKTLPIWERYKSKSLGLCGGIVERVPPSLQSEATRREVMSGGFRAQTLRAGSLKPGAGPGLGPAIDFQVAGEIEDTEEQRQFEQETRSRRARFLAVTPDGDYWVAEALGVIRYFPRPKYEPKAILVGKARVPFGKHLIAPLPDTPDLVSISASCPHWR